MIFVINSQLWALHRASYKNALQMDEVVDLIEQQNVDNGILWNEIYPKYRQRVKNLMHIRGLQEK